MQAKAVFRFYEELNDFLPVERRKREFEIEFDAPVPVRHLIERMGVPHTEVELILINARSVDLQHPAANGDRISVYPVFEALDVTPLIRLREHPLRDPRFLADVHLGKLARYLRMLGFDTLLAKDGVADGELSRLAARQRRMVLTRDRALLMRKEVTRGCYIRRGRPREQLAQVIRRLDLGDSLRPFTRCIRCNEPLQGPLPKAQVWQQLPPRTREAFAEFWRCSACAKLYWRGSHFARMQAIIQALQGGLLRDDVGR